jgi:YHS domain-containing protein
MKSKFAYLVAVFALLNLHCNPTAEPPVAPPSPAVTPAPESEEAIPPAPETDAPAAEMAPETEAAPAIDINTLALKVDPVCKMSLEEHPATATEVYEGKTYGFCSAFCGKKFAEDPAKILARFEASTAETAAPAEQ